MGPELSGAGGAGDLSWILSPQQSGAAAPGPRFAPLQLGVPGPPQHRPPCRATGGHPSPTAPLRGTLRCGWRDASVRLSVRPSHPSFSLSDIPPSTIPDSGSSPPLASSYRLQSKRNDSCLLAARPGERFPGCACTRTERRAGGRGSADRCARRGVGIASPRGLTARRGARCIHGALVGARMCNAVHSALSLGSK